MTMSRLLKNYIKLLIESIEDNETKYNDIITVSNNAWYIIKD